MQNYSIVFMSEMVIDQQDIMFPGCLSVRPVFGLSVFHVSGLTICHVSGFTIVRLSMDPSIS